MVLALMNGQTHPTCHPGPSGLQPWPLSSISGGVLTSWSLEPHPRQGVSACWVCLGSPEIVMADQLGTLGAGSDEAWGEGRGGRTEGVKLGKFLTGH